MRLTTLCICGTLLAFSSLSQMTADEGVLLGDQGFGPCTATLRPGGACRPGEHESTCPYFFSLPPLTLHLPQQFRELEKIMQDLQKLKESVDELREMCTDCTVSHSERECGKQREREHEKLNEGKAAHDEGMKWMNVKPEENDRGFRQQCGKDVVEMEKMDGDNDAEERLILDENTRKKWDADRQSDKGVIKENEREGTQAEETEKDGKTKTEGERKKDPPEQTNRTTTGANVVDVMSEKFSKTNNGQGDVNKNKEDEVEDNSKRYQEDKLENERERTMTIDEQNNEKIEGNDPQMWKEETKKKEKNTQPEGGHKIKMSENHGEHTNKEQEQHREETRKEMDKGTKKGRNNEKPKQSESTGETEKEKTIKEGELDEKGREMEKDIEIGSVWKDSDGELSSRTATEWADFLSISPTSHSTTRLASRLDSMDSIKAKIFTSSLPSPPLPSSTLSSITDVSRDTEAVYGPTLSTGPGAAGFPEPQSPEDEELATTTNTITMVGGLTPQITSTATRSNSPSMVEVGARFQGHVSSTTTPTTTTLHPKQYITSFPRVTDNNRWTPKKNFSSNTKTSVKPLPGKGPKPGKKLESGIKPEAEQKLKNPKNDHKPDHAPFADKTKDNQKKKPSSHKPTTNKSKPGKDSKQTQILKPDPQTPPDILVTDKNLKKNLTTAHNQDHTANQNKMTVQKPKSPQKSGTPVRGFTTQRPQSVNTTRSDKYPPINRKHSSDKVADQNAKPEKKQFHFLTNGKPDQKQKPEKKPKSDEKTKSDERLETNQNPTPVQEPDSKRSQTVTFTPKPNQRYLTESVAISEENHSNGPKSNSDSTPGQKNKTGQTKTPHQKPKPSLKIPKINQKSNPAGEPESERSETSTPKLNQNPLTESVKESDENYTHESKSNPDSMPGQKIKAPPNTLPDQRPKSNKKIPKINQTPQPDQEPESKKSETATPKPNQHPMESVDESGENPSNEPKSNSVPTPGQKITSDQIKTVPDQNPKSKKKIPKITQEPKPGQDPDSWRIETATPKPNQKPLTASGNESGEMYTHEAKTNPDSFPRQKITSETNTPPDQRSESNDKIPQITQKPKPGQDPDSERREIATPKPNQKPLTASGNESGEMYTHEAKTNPDFMPRQKITSETNTPPDQRSESNDKIPQINQKLKPGKEPESERSEKATPKHNQKPATESVNKSDKNPLHESKSNQDSVRGQTPEPNRDNTPSDQKPKQSWNASKINHKPKPGQIFKPNQKRPKPAEILKTEPSAKPKPKQAPKNNPNLKTPKPGQKPNLKPKSVPDKLPKVVPDKTLLPKPPSRHRPQTRPTVNPGPKPIERPKTAVQPKPSQKTKTHSDPPQISWTASNSIQNSQTDMPPTSGLIKQIVEVTQSPGDTEFSASMRKTITLGPKTSDSLETGPNPHRHPEDFTLSPNSRIMSDLKPQTTSQPPSIQMTTRPNKINRGILRSVITSTSPGSTHPSLVAKSESRTQANILHNVEETRPAASVASPSSQTSSTLSSEFGSATPVTSGPKTPAAEMSTPSTRELRVKINQVAAFLNNSLSPNGRPAHRLPKEQPEGTLGGNRPDRTDSKLPTSEPTKVSRDCSDLLLRGETKSGVYLVTPDLRSRSFPVFCDMKRHGGGWSLLQRRQDGSVSFNRTWAEYQSGFGELNGGEFWLGNNMIHLLTRDRDMVLRVELEDFDGVKEYAQYEQFRVAGERLRYRLTIGGYSGTAGDALRFNKMYDHNNRAFTTPDKDHDRYPSGNCGAYYSSGWWFDACMAANLNGRYYIGKYKGVRDGIYWGTWHNISKEYYPTNDRESFKTVRMMIRPKGFAP